MNAIGFDDVRLTLGGRIILDAVNLQIAAGAFVGVLGPNGAGKTTLMRAILGLVQPDRGSITVLGEPATRGNPAIGYMPQVRGMPAPQLSGRDFVAGAVQGHRLGLPILGRAGQAEVDRVLELVGARDLARRKLGSLSGGERQRLLLAQALIGRPRLLLLDEPLISLDPHRQAEIVALTRTVQQELGITLLFTAHELNPLLAVMDRVLYLGSGHAALGAVEDVITGPVLSRLYGAPIDVLHVQGRIFVMSGGHEIERDEHRHGHGTGHDHAAHG